MALVMFDYDGVIVDSLAQASRDFMQACQENGFPELDRVEEFIDLFDGNIFESMQRQGVAEATIDRILKAYQNYADQHLDQVRPFPGMKEVLEQIAAAHEVVVITSNVSEVTRKILKQNGITSVAGVIGADQEKSKIRKIGYTMERHRQRPAYYVGDTAGDIEEGRKAGTITVATCWGWHDEERLKASRPDFLVRSPRELAALFNGDR